MVIVFLKSTKFELTSSTARVTSMKSQQQESVSEWVRNRGNDRIKETLTEGLMVQIWICLQDLGHYLITYFITFVFQLWWIRHLTEGWMVQMWICLRDLWRCLSSTRLSRPPRWPGAWSPSPSCTMISYGSYPFLLVIILQNRYKKY